MSCRERKKIQNLNDMTFAFACTKKEGSEFVHMQIIREKRNKRSLRERESERERGRKQNLRFCIPFEYFSLGNKVLTVTEIDRNQVWFSTVLFIIP